MFWLELIVLLGMLLVGARVGGIFLGMSSGVSLAVLIFGFGCTPGKPPITENGLLRPLPSVVSPA